MTDNYYEINGKFDGPTSIVLTGIHGNETSGIKAFENILPNLAIQNGKVIFVYGNPKAIAANERFVEANLNRLFKPEAELSESEKSSYEFGRAKTLKTILDQADVLLDLHNSFTPESRPFVICEPNSMDITKFLPAQTIVHGFDEVEPGGTDYYMNKNGKVGICMETGYFGDANSIQIAETAIINFLKAINHIPNDLTPTEQTKLNMYELYFTKTDSFKLVKPFADFEKVAARAQIGTDGEEEVAAQKDSYILFARDRSAIGEEAFLLGEKI